MSQVSRLVLTHENLRLGTLIAIAEYLQHTVRAEIDYPLRN